MIDVTYSNISPHFFIYWYDFVLIVLFYFSYKDIKVGGKKERIVVEKEAISDSIEGFIEEE